MERGEYMNSPRFHDRLKSKVDAYAHAVYQMTKAFPRHERFGLTSQLNRSAISVALNYIEGFARSRKLPYIQFLEISYGSLKESRYLLSFCYKENLMDEIVFSKIDALADDIGSMLWILIERKKQDS